MPQKPALNDMAEEMTGGNTADPFEAFEQWKAEREALAEFFDISQAQDIQLIRVTQHWRILAGLIWGRNRHPGEYIKEIKQKDLEKLRDAGEELDRITKRIQDLSRDEQEAVAKAIQLPLFKKLQKEKDHGTERHEE